MCASQVFSFLCVSIPTYFYLSDAGASGYLMPGSLTLCLGPLASGQTALTKILAGRSWVDKKTWHQSGRVTYNGKDLRDVQISRCVCSLRCAVICTASISEFCQGIRSYSTA